MSFPDWIDDLATSVARDIGEELLGPEVPLYRESFAGPALAPAPDYFRKGPLQLGDSANLSTGVTLTPAPNTVPAPAQGLRLEIDGQQPDIPVSVALSVGPFPTALQTLRLVGRFRTVPSLAAVAGPWAVAVQVREGGADDVGSDSQRISATVRTKNGVTQLNSPSPQGTAPSADRAAILHPPAASQGIEFTVQLFLDLAGDGHAATLITPDSTDVRPIAHAALPALWEETRVGIALVRAATQGHVAVDVLSFEVYGILAPGILARRGQELMRLVRRALLPRFVPPRPLR